MTNINITIRDPYIKWYNHRAGELVVHGRGYAFFQGQYLEGNSLVFKVWQYFQTADMINTSMVDEFCRQLNGAWALCIEVNNKQVFVVTDRFRNIPLFYSLIDDKLFVAASVEDILKKMNSVEIDDDLALEFLLSRNVMCGDTFYKGIRQVLPGEIVYASVKEHCLKIHSRRYYRFLPNGYSTDSEPDLQKQLADIVHSVLHRFVNACRGKTIFIPLSGGLDSRLLVAMLKKFGHKDVVCYSYGNKENPEAVLSKKVADYLGYEWRFIESSPVFWARAIGSQKMADYWEYSSKGVCLPHLIEYPVYSYLSKDKGLNANSTIWPGIAMDFLAGSLLKSTASIEQSSYEMAEEYILRRRYNLWPLDSSLKQYSNNRHLRKRLLKSIEVSGRYDPLSLYELFELEHRISGFLNNSVRLYEFYGKKWHLPFWDYEFVDFFLTLPLDVRFNKMLYINALRENLFVGALAGLKDIPIYDFQKKYRYWDKRITTESAKQYKTNGLIRKAGVNLLTVFGLFDSVNRLRKKNKPPVEFLGADWWFSQNQAPDEMELNDAIKPFRALDILPESLIDVFKPWLNSTLNSRKPYSIAAILLLTRVYEKYGQK